MEYLDCVFICACMYVVRVTIMEEETVPQKMERAGQAVMMAQVQQVSCLTAPAEVRMSAEIWRGMEERGACPMCQRKEMKTKTLDLGATDSAETQVWK